ncbi:MAG: tol-pal system-associated acyl-CoA thioesterase [Steroidobacteraceae bacterium]|jgi:acyl-CoA thioester hydrolase
MASGAHFTWQVRVYWEDTDAGGIVYYANYLRFLERARTEWLRAKGFEQGALLADERIQFAVVEVGVAYRAPARYGDLLEVTARVQECRKASISFAQEVRRLPDRQLLVEATVRAASLDADTLRPRPLPSGMREALLDG